MVQVLLKDIAISNAHVNRDEDKQFWRRSFCRNVFAFIEGQTSMLKAVGIGLELNRYKPGEWINLATLWLLMDTTYTITDTGKVKEVDQKQNTLAVIAYVLRTVGSLLGLPETEADKMFAEDNGWQKLREANATRGKLMHPKTEEDLDITDAKLETVAKAFNWFQRCLTKINDLIPEHLLMPKES
jgi:hypothetical protein